MNCFDIATLFLCRLWEQVGGKDCWKQRRRLLGTRRQERLARKKAGCMSPFEEATF